MLRCKNTKAMFDTVLGIELYISRNEALRKHLRIVEPVELNGRGKPRD